MVEFSEAGARGLVPIHTDHTLEFVSNWANESVGVNGPLPLSKKGTVLRSPRLIGRVPKTNVVSNWEILRPRWGKDRGVDEARL